MATFILGLAVAGIIAHAIWLRLDEKERQASWDFHEIERRKRDKDRGL